MLGPLGVYLQLNTYWFLVGTTGIQSLYKPKTLNPKLLPSFPPETLNQWNAGLLESMCPSLGAELRRSLNPSPTMGLGATVWGLGSKV